MWLEWPMIILWNILRFILFSANSQWNFSMKFEEISPSNLTFNLRNALMYIQSYNMGDGGIRAVWPHPWVEINASLVVWMHVPEGGTTWGCSYLEVDVMCSDNNMNKKPPDWLPTCLSCHLIGQSLRSALPWLGSWLTELGLLTHHKKEMAHDWAVTSLSCDLIGRPHSDLQLTRLSDLMTDLKSD